MDRLLLRPAEAAEILGIGTTRLYALLHSGDVQSIRIGRSLRVPVDALHAYVATQLAEGMPESINEGTGALPSTDGGMNQEAE